VEISTSNNSNFAFEYSARGATAGKPFDENFLYEEQLNLLSYLSLDALTDG
jgi:hypothetical protein